MPRPTIPLSTSYSEPARLTGRTIGAAAATEKKKELRLSREEQARREVGETCVTRGTATLLVAIFVATVLAVPVAQHVLELRSTQAGSAGASTFSSAFAFFQRLPAAARVWRDTPGSLWQRLNAANGQLLSEMRDYESTLEDESFFSRVMLPRTQLLLTAVGAGNEKTYVGRDSWLFYRPDVEYLTAPGFLDGGQEQADTRHDPVRAIVAFRDQLAARDIELVVVPTPSKAAIHPEKFSRRATSAQRGMQNPSFVRWRQALEHAGVHVFDPTPALVDLAGDAEAPQFLATDSHWRPDAMQAVARRLATWLGNRKLFPASPQKTYRTTRQVVRNLGDTAAMLRLPGNDKRFAPETVAIEQVLENNGHLWSAERSSDVLLLGDSFSNIYSLPAMNWGEAAGFAEHLSLHLQRPVDCILRNDDGAFATREALSRELAQGSDRLAGKRVVIWQFAVRELTHGNWKNIELAVVSPGSGPDREFVAPAPGEAWEVTGEIREISSVPRPGSVPYPEHIVAVHLGAVRKAGAQAIAGDAVVYLWSMRENSWTAAARWRTGDRVQLRLQAWSDVALELERFNRSELSDVALQLHEPCWGEPLDP